jgi:hypothetical protein
MEENYNFLLQNAKETHDEVIELANDAIDYTINFAKKPDIQAEMIRSCVSAYVFHILQPQSSALYIDLLTGNVPGCFNKLRLLLEGLIKSYEADMQFKEQTFFMEKVQSLEEEIYPKGKTSISKLMEKHGKKHRKLWQKLSNDWIHTGGLVKKIMEPLLSQNKEMPSSWALYFPAGYSPGDLSELSELQKDVSLFRKLLDADIQKFEMEKRKL